MTRADGTDLQPTPQPERLDVSNLLVSILWRAPGRARREIVGRLRTLGDRSPHVMPTGRRGLLAARTSLDPRSVVRGLHEMAVASPGRFRTTCKWVPVDLWTAGDLEAMRGGLERLQSRIEPTERWRMTVERRTPGGIPTPAVIAALAELIPARVDLTHPDKIVMVQLFSERTALSVLAPPDVFSLVPAPWQAAVGTRAAASQRGGSVHEAPTMPSSPGTAGDAYP